MADADGLDAEQLVVLRRIFQEEAVEHLDALAREILDLERAGPERLATDFANDMLRRTHSLKGSAMSIGMTAIGELCHDFETLLKKAVEKPEAGACDAMLAAIDWIRDALVTPDLEQGRALRARLLEAARALDGTARRPGEARAKGKKKTPIAAAPAAPTPAATPETQGPNDDTVRVGMKLLDGMLEEADNLLLLRLRCQHAAEDADALRTKLESATKALDGQHPSRPTFVESRKTLDALERTISGIAHHMGILVGGFRDRISEMRMVPVELALEPLRRMARDLARRQGKEVDLHLVGEDVRLDKKLVELIKDPLVHLVRNAVDHGCDPPDVRRARGKPPAMTLTIRADAAEGAVVIEVTDDGRGIDPVAVREAAVRRGIVTPQEAAELPAEAAIDLVFQPGVSTAKALTDVSGRGVGLDVVRHNVSLLGGSVRAFNSIQGAGFLLTIPLTISATQGLLVRAGAHVYCMPLAAVDEIVAIDAERIGASNGKSYLVCRNRPVAFASLSELLSGPEGKDESRFAALLHSSHSSDRAAAVGIHEVLGQQEVVIKPLPPQLQRVWGIAGATTLGNGNLVPVLDTRDLVEGTLARTAPARKQEGTRRRIVVADDTLTTRMVVAGVLSAAGFEVEAVGDGVAALETLERGGADLVVSDVDMPRMNGLELTRRLRASDRWRNLPVVLVSSHGDPGDIETGSKAGADAYIVKRDFAGSTLVGVIRRLLPDRSS